MCISLLVYRYKYLQDIFEVCLKTKGKTAVHGCRCSGDVAVCVCKVAARQAVGWCTSVTCSYEVCQN